MSSRSQVRAMNEYINSGEGDRKKMLAKRAEQAVEMRKIYTKTAKDAIDGGLSILVVVDHDTNGDVAGFHALVRGAEGAEGTMMVMQHLQDVSAAMESQLTNLLSEQEFDELYAHCREQIDDKAGPYSTN